MKSCLVNYISLQCPEHGTFQEVVTNTLEAMLVGCKDGRIAQQQNKSSSVRFYPYLALLIFGYAYTLYI